MENTNRRTFIAGALAIGVAGTVNALPQIPQQMKMPIVHHVFFWLKNSRSQADTAKLIEGLESLKAIGKIKLLHIGVPASTEQRPVVDSSFDVSELMYFESVEDQKTYQDHPIHQAFVANYSSLWDKVIVYDVKEV